MMGQGLIKAAVEAAAPRREPPSATISSDSNARPQSPTVPNSIALSARIDNSGAVAASHSVSFPIVRPFSSRASTPSIIGSGPTLVSRLLAEAAIQTEDLPMQHPEAQRTWSTNRPLSGLKLSPLTGYQRVSSSEAEPHVEPQADGTAAAAGLRRDPSVLSYEELMAWQADRKRWQPERKYKHWRI